MSITTESPLKAITKEIRKNLKYLKDRGFKISVKIRNSTVVITISENPSDFIVLNPHYDRHISWLISTRQFEGGWDTDKDPREEFTQEAKDLLEEIKAIGQKYQDMKLIDYYDSIYNGNYFLDVKYDWRKYK